MADDALAQEIQQKLEIMTRMAKLADSIQVVDGASWHQKHEVEQAYMEANDWLLAHGIQPIYDHQQQRYVGVPISKDEGEQP